MDEAQKAKHRERMRRYYDSHPEQRQLQVERSRAWRAANRDRHRAYQANWRQQNPDHNRQWHQAHPEAIKASILKSKFGVTLDQYNEILAAQDGGCFFCHKPETAKRSIGPVRYLSVDHDHLTGRVRGLLCLGCNISLGYYERGYRSRLDPADVATYLDASKWF